MRKKMIVIHHSSILCAIFASIISGLYPTSLPFLCPVHNYCICSVSIRKVCAASICATVKILIEQISFISSGLLQYSNALSYKSTTSFAFVRSVAILSFICPNWTYAPCIMGSISIAFSNSLIAPGKSGGAIWEEGWIFTTANAALTTE